MLGTIDTVAKNAVLKRTAPSMNWSTNSEVSSVVWVLRTGRIMPENRRSRLFMAPSTNPNNPKTDTHGSKVAI